MPRPLTCPSSTARRRVPHRASVTRRCTTRSTGDFPELAGQPRPSATAAHDGCRSAVAMLPPELLLAVTSGLTADPATGSGGAVLLRADLASLCPARWDDPQAVDIRRTSRRRRGASGPSVGWVPAASRPGARVSNPPQQSRDAPLGVVIFHSGFRSSKETSGRFGDVGALVPRGAVAAMGALVAGRSAADPVSAGQPSQIRWLG